MESKKIKIQIRSWFGKILFEHESENNTVKETLRNAFLSGADLSDADLSGAVLRNADLRNAFLSGAVLPIYCRWAVSIYNDKIKIGCKTKTIADWDLWFAGTEVFTHDRNSDNFKRIHANYLAAKAYYEFMNS